MSDPKLPRDWLLARHQSVVPQLEAIRRAALPATTTTWRGFIRELFHPHRKVWSALAIVWIALVIFHFSTAHPQPPRLANPPTSEEMATWLNQIKSNESFAQN
jgi:hypothetical protein